MYPRGQLQDTPWDNVFHAQEIASYHAPLEGPQAGAQHAAPLLGKMKATEHAPGFPGFMFCLPCKQIFLGSSCQIMYTVARRNLRLESFAAALPRASRFFVFCSPRCLKRGSLPSLVYLCRSGAPASPFKINTCKSVSKQRTLSAFRMNTCEKRGEGVAGDAGHTQAQPKSQRSTREDQGIIASTGSE
jgi:hypothetical protein